MELGVSQRLQDRGVVAPRRADYGAVQLEEGDIIYVGQSDFNEFLEKAFPKIKKSIVLVVAQEDSGAPLGLFGYPSNRLVAPVAASKGFRQFLEDPRLRRLYVQNFDFDVAACRNQYVPSRVECEPELTVLLANLPQKVVPIPIGLDLHTRAELPAPDLKRFHHTVPQTECDQITDLRSFETKAGVWAKKRECLSITFTEGLDHACHYPRPPKHRCPRKWVLNIAQEADLCIETDIGSRNATWDGAAGNAFALAPQGHGPDTHRFWELLHLDVVPVVASSSLDPLYTLFPCIILDSWTDLKRSSIAEWRDTIRRQWGPDPFTPMVKHRLSSDFWIDLIQSNSPLPS